MDSLTQAVLGAAVGHAVAGRRLGRRAAAWGAVAGTLPDLDVLAYPFLDPAGELQVHRGLTHGLAFGLVVGPALGWLAWRLARWRGTPRGAPGALRSWTALWTLGLVTHPVLDTFTVYGTQLLAPFSDRPFAIGSVFIIDPLYTVPLLVCLAAALVRRRPRLALVGLAVSTAYLGWSLAAQQLVAARAGPRLAGAERVLVTPAPLQTLLWRVEAERDGAVAPYLASVLVPGGLAAQGPPVPLVSLPDATEAGRGARTLRWFSRGWLVQPGDDPLDVADARFGRGPDGAHVFRWRLAPDGSTFRQLPFRARLDAGVLRDLVDGALRGPAARGPSAPPRRTSPPLSPPPDP